MKKIVEIMEIYSVTKETLEVIDGWVDLNMRHLRKVRIMRTFGNRRNPKNQEERVVRRASEIQKRIRTKKKTNAPMLRRRHHRENRLGFVDVHGRDSLLCISRLFVIIFTDYSREMARGNHEFSFVTVFHEKINAYDLDLVLPQRTTMADSCNFWLQCFSSTEEK